MARGRLAQGPGAVVTGPYRREDGQGQRGPSKSQGGGLIVGRQRDALENAFGR